MLIIFYNSFHSGEMQNLNSQTRMHLSTFVENAFMLWYHWLFSVYVIAFVTGLPKLLLIFLQITAFGTCWRSGSVLFWKDGNLERNIWSLTSPVFCYFHKGITFDIFLHCIICLLNTFLVRILHECSCYNGHCLELINMHVDIKYVQYLVQK